MSATKSTRLDLALALAGVARGFTARRKDDDNISIILKPDGFIYVHKDTGRDCRIEHSALWLDWGTQCWYLEGDDNNWIDKPVKEA